MPEPIVVGSVGTATVPATTTADTTTTSDLINQTKRHLYTGSREELNKLSVAMAAGDATMTVVYDPGGLQKGSKASVDLEDMYVWSTAGQTVTVERGQFGSTASNHGVNSLVTVNAKFSDYEILKALNDELREMSSPSNGLFQIKTVDVTFKAAVEGYDLTGVTDMLGVYEVRWKPVDVSKSWPRIDHYTVSRNMSTSEFASGYVLLLYESPVPGRTVHVRYKAPFSPLATLTETVTAATGIHSQAIDILPLGAAVRLGAGREVKRNFTETQGDTRRAAEVPAGANLNAIRALDALRVRRIAEEAERLQQMYPIRRGFL